MFTYKGLGTYKRTHVGRFDSFKSAVGCFFRFVIRWSLISAAAYAIFMAGTSTVIASEPVTVVAPAPVGGAMASGVFGSPLWCVPA